MTINKLTYISRKRNATSDIISGFCILYMIYGHISFITCLLGNFLLEWPGYILFCYMPWFFFKSGIHYKGATPIQTIRKGVKRLLVPYIVFTLVGCLVTALSYFQNGNFNIISMLKSTVLHILQQESADGNIAMWFLLVLFIVNVILSFCYVHKMVYIVLILSIIFASFTPLLDCNPWRWVNVLPAMVFVSLGYILNKYQLIQHRVTFLLAVISYFGIRICYPSYVEFYPNDLYKGNYTLWLASATSMIVILYCLVDYFKDNICLKPFEFIGRNTMTLYVCHWPLLLVVKMVAESYQLSQVQTLISMVISCIVILPICHYLIKRLNWGVIIGESK